MLLRYKLVAAAAAVALLPAAALARTEMRAVGSSTVYPFAKAVAENVARANPRVRPPVIESTGTGAGMKLFCAGVGERFPDVANASRRIKASEARACAANGVSQITEVLVGLDGLALITAPRTPLANLSQRDIYLAIAKTPFGRPNRARSWKDVNASLPAIPIRVFGPPPTSGTRDALGELFMTAACEKNDGMAALKKTNEAKFKAICTGVREDGAFIQSGENDNLIVQKIAANPGTIGVLGYSFLEENAGRVKGIAVNGVPPSYQSIASFRYPGARPLYLYVKNAHVRAIPAVRAFLAEFTKETTFGPRGYLVRRGLIAAPDAARQRSIAAARALAPLYLAGLK